MISNIFTTATLASILTTTLAMKQFVIYTPGGDDTSVERIDPILSPGKISQHVHQVFGSSGLSPDMTYDSLQNADCTTMGTADGHGVEQDHSVYWHPALYMKLKDGSGLIRINTSGHKTYYRDAGADKTPLHEFPHGFRMMAGNPFMREAASSSSRQGITQWICHKDTPWIEGKDGGFPKGVSDCASYPGFNGAIHFPHCWNGQDFNPAAPGAHMAYPDGHFQDGHCPSSHPTRLPHIFIENQFDLHHFVDLVEPDSFVLAQGDNTGFGWHADFFNGWEDGAIPNLLNACPYNFYGNEDVGICGPKLSSVKAKNCNLPKYFNEEIDRPGKYLPGCNPISEIVGMAMIQPIAPLGVSTNDCSAYGSTHPSPIDQDGNLVIGGSDSGSDVSASAADEASTYSSIGVATSPVAIYSTSSTKVHTSSSTTLTTESSSEAKLTSSTSLAAESSTEAKSTSTKIHTTLSTSTSEARPIATSTLPLSLPTLYPVESSSPSTSAVEYKSSSSSSSSSAAKAETTQPPFYNGSGWHNKVTGDSNTETDDDDDVVIVTEWITVTVHGYAPAVRARRDHARVHARRHHAGLF